jgi:predicted nuclease with TOPRIM domain
MMNEKILAAIEETLPQMQVDAIRKALTELDDLKETSKEQKQLLHDYTERDRSQRQRNQELEQQVADLTGKLNTVTTERNILKEQSIRAQVDALQGKLDAVNGTVDKFLKNTIYREKLQHQVADEYSTVQTTYLNGQQVAVPTPSTTHRQVEDTKTTETE